MQKRRVKVYQQAVTKMNRRTIILCIILAILAYYNQNTLAYLVKSVKTQTSLLLNTAQKTIESIPQPISIQNNPNDLPATSNNTKPAEDINTPGPLQTFISETLNNNTPVDGAIGIGSIIYSTNIERNNNGKKPLIENTTLDRTAYAKAKDMLDRQYFEHISPSGKGVGDLANNVGYDYITVGENLALGNFTTSADIVTAWMNSPGHRANILNDAYTEIGVGIVSGMYEGRNVWIAVQHFGRPLSDCPTINNVLKNTINKNEKDANIMQTELSKQKTVIDAPGTNAQPDYIQLVNTYNELVKKYNTLIATTKDQITEYNKQIQKFNKCISQPAAN